MKTISILAIMLISIGGVAQPLVVTDELDFISLSGKTWVYLDSSLSLSANEILDIPSKRWEKQDFDDFSESVVWIKVPLFNASQNPIDRILYINNPFLQAADIYLVVEGKIQRFKAEMGLARPMSNKSYFDPMFPLMINIPSNRQTDLLVKTYDQFSTTNCPMFLLSEQSAHKLKDWRLQVNFLWFGLILLSLIIALFLWLYTHQPIFLYYLLLGLGTAIVITANTGMASMYIHSDPYQILNNYYELGGALVINFMPRFMNQVVAISKINGRFWVVIKWIGYLSFFVVVLYAIPALKMSYEFSKFSIYCLVAAACFVFFYLLLALAIAAFKGIKRASILFFVYIIYLGIALAIVLAPFVGINYNGLNAIYVMVAGSAFETIAFMILMAQVTLSIYQERDRLSIQVRNNQQMIINAIVEGQELERKRIASDIHDGLGQMISSLMLSLKSQGKVSHSPSNYGANFLKSALRVLEKMHAEIKSICFDLTPQALLSQGLGEALNELADTTNLLGKVKVHSYAHSIDQRLAAVLETSVYRIAQEWLNNILKHNNASKIDINATMDDEFLTLIIEDNGYGFDPSTLNSSTGNGWKNIKSRIELISGELTLDTNFDMPGTTLILNVPRRCQ